MSRPTRIAVVGDRNPDVIAHRAIPVALDLVARDRALHHEWISTTDITNASDVRGFDGIWVVPNSPYRNTDGALLAIRTARELGIPFLGTCGGFQHAIVEYARGVLGWHDAEHAELSPTSPRLVVTPLVCELVEVTGTIHLAPGSRLREAYAADSAVEGFHCRFGVSPEFAAAVDGSALRITAVDAEGDTRGVELEGHPFFVGTLFQPERAALEHRTPPVVRAFVAAARARA